jgi:hypothetical protein
MLRVGLELIDTHVRERGSEDFEQVLHRKPRHRLPIARQHGLEWLGLRELRLFFHDHRDPLQAVNYLRVHWMFQPERAVLVEYCDAGFWGDLVRI